MGRAIDPVDYTSSGLAVSCKEMARLKFKITDEFMKQIVADADRIWPGQGMIAVNRIVRDSLRRFWRYCGGNGRAERPDG